MVQRGFGTRNPKIERPGNLFGLLCDHNQGVQQSRECHMFQIDKANSKTFAK